MLQQRYLTDVIEKQKNNKCFQFGITPMHLAAQEDQVAVAKVLYDNGSLVDPLTKSGNVPYAR